MLALRDCFAALCYPLKFPQTPALDSVPLSTFRLVERIAIAPFGAVPRARGQP